MSAWEKEMEDKVSELKERDKDQEETITILKFHITELKEDLFQFEERIYNNGIIPRPLEKLSFRHNNGDGTSPYCTACGKIHEKVSGGEKDIIIDPCHPCSEPKLNCKECPIFPNYKNSKPPKPNFDFWGNPQDRAYIRYKKENNL